jgi:hypothetical protein
VGVKSNACSVLVGKYAGKSQLGNRRCRWEDDMKKGLKKQDERVWAGLIWLKIGTRGCCEHSNEPWGFHKAWGIS